VETDYLSDPDDDEDDYKPYAMNERKEEAEPVT